MKTTQQLQQHARDLADAFSIRLVESPLMRPEEAFAVPAIRLVVMCPISDETTYAVALHEMGHLCAALGAIRHVVKGDVANLKRDEEDAAWTWARHMALDWTPAMEQVATWAEGTYAPPAPRKFEKQIDWNKYGRGGK